MMRLLLAPQSLLHLITTILLTPRPTAAGPHLPRSALAGFSYDELFARYSCSGELCGWEDQLCCASGSACYTDAADQAQCSSTAGSSGDDSTSTGGYWEYFTTTYVLTETDLSTITSTSSTYQPYSVSAAAATTTAVCNYALDETPCGDVCCSKSDYCVSSGVCAYNPQASTGYTTLTLTSTASSAATPGAPVRETSSAVTYVTQTTSPTSTIPFQTPVATGSNITIVSQEHQGDHLSGGAIAGIVIGVLVAVALLVLLCFYCCLKGLLDGLLALFGLRSNKKRRVTEIDEYDRRTHRSSRGGERTWYGAAKPARVERTEKRASHLGRDMLGVGAGLAGLWAILGLKRRNNQKKRNNQEKYSEYSYSSDYYTSASSASSDDRRTRYTDRRSVVRSMSRR